MLIKAAAIVVLSGSILAVVFGSPGMTHFLPASSAVRDTSPRLVLHTQGWFQDLFGGGRSERPSSRMSDQNEGRPTTSGGRVLLWEGIVPCVCAFAMGSIGRSAIQRSAPDFHEMPNNARPRARADHSYSCSAPGAKMSIIWSISRTFPTPN